MSQENWPEDDRRDDEFMGEPQGRPAKSKSSTCLIIALCVTGVSLLICCGGGYFFYKKAFETVTDKAEVRERTQDIATIDVPEDWDPMAFVSMNFMGNGMGMARYTVPGGQFMLMEIFVSDAQAAPQMDAAMQEQRNEIAQVKDEEDRQTREFEIRGETVEFTFLKGKDDQGNEINTVTGDFPRKNGLPGRVSFIYQTSVENYDEDAIVEVIESIE